MLKTINSRSSRTLHHSMVTQCSLHLMRRRFSLFKYSNSCTRFRRTSIHIFVARLSSLCACVSCMLLDSYNHYSLIFQGSCAYPNHTIKHRLTHTHTRTHFKSHQTTAKDTKPHRNKRIPTKGDLNWCGLVWFGHWTDPKGPFIV